MVRHHGQVRHRLRTGVTVPNALAVTADGRQISFTDTARILKTYPADEHPDCAAFDRDGALWVAVVGPGRVDRILPDGTTADSLHLPVSRPTKVAFGGANLATLIITSQRRFLDFGALADLPLADCLLAADIGATGVGPFKVAISPRAVSGWASSPGAKPPDSASAWRLCAGVWFAGSDFGLTFLPSVGR